MVAAAGDVTPSVVLLSTTVCDDVLVVAVAAFVALDNVTALASTVFVVKLTSLPLTSALTVIAAVPSLSCFEPSATDVSVAAESASPSDCVPVLPRAIALLRFASTVTELSVTVPTDVSFVVPVVVAGKIGNIAGRVTAVVAATEPLFS